MERWETLRGPEVGRGRRVTQALFVEERSEREKVIDGPGPTFDSVRKSTGVQTVLGLSKVNDVLSEALMTEEVLWVNVPTEHSLTAPLAREMSLARDIRLRFPWVAVRNVAPLVHAMRRVKDSYEIDCLRRAYQIHTKVYEKIMRALRPGTNEALGEAIWFHDTKQYGPDVSGSTLDLSESQIIVGSGPNTIIAHYRANDRDILAGDLVLLDAGVAVDGYSSDITRTFPASGRFTPRQRELYAIVLEAQHRAIDTMKPGSTLRIAHEAIYDTMKKHGLERHSYGVAGHPVGLNIHDATGVSRMDRDHPFEPGVVIAIEPFLFMPEEGIGIRIEDGVLITLSGHEVLAGPPKEINDLEGFLRRR